MTSQIIYKGNLRTEAKHLYSGHIVETDAPLDNEGLAERFSPTDLVATALGSCMLTIMGIAGKKHAINIDGTTVTINKIMESNPRRISTIEVVFTMPKAINYTEKEQKILENAANTCPVFYSLAAEIKKEITFNW
jgi:putative redox protein